MYPAFGRQARSLRSTIWSENESLLCTSYFVLGTWYSPRIPTSSFFNQRSIFDISYNAVFRLPAAGKYFLLRTLYMVLSTWYMVQ